MAKAPPHPLPGNPEDAADHGQSIPPARKNGPASDIEASRSDLQDVLGKEGLNRDGGGGGDRKGNVCEGIHSSQLDPEGLDQVHGDGGDDHVLWGTTRVVMVSHGCDGHGSHMGVFVGKGRDEMVVCRPERGPIKRGIGEVEEEIVGIVHFFLNCWKSEKLRRKVKNEARHTGSDGIFEKKVYRRHLKGSLNIPHHTWMDPSIPVYATPILDENRFCKVLWLEIWVRLSSP